MTNHETAAIDRIPITQSVSYAVRDAPELPAHGATIPGTTLAPTKITFTYQAAPDSQLGRIQARVKGFWMRDGGRVNPGQPMAQHYFDGLTDWPGWLAEEARLHDPEAAASVPPPAPRADALRWAADRLVEEIQRGARFSHEDARQPGLAESVMLLRRWADEAQQPEPPSAALARQAQETLIRRITEGPCVAGEQQNETPEAEAPVVAYRSRDSRSLYCTAHAGELFGLSYEPVTAEDLPDGGICTYPDCGRDVLAEPHP